jgi:ParB-like chromosome segregation protein Spo0J
MATATKHTTTAKSRARQPQVTTNGHVSLLQHLFPLSDDQETTPFQRIPINLIAVPSERRALHGLTNLKQSIQDIGLLHPIIVMKHGEASYQLIAGRNRLAACQQLGWTHIPAHIVPFEATEQADTLTELAKIDENLIRNDLTVLEYAEHLQRRKQVYLTLHPAKKQGGSPGMAGGGKKAKRPESGRFVPSFLEDTAQKTGQGRSTVAEAIQIADHLAEDVKRQLRGTPIADRKTDLLRLAKMEPTTQQAVVQTIVQHGLSTVTKAVQLLRHAEREQDLAARTQHVDAYQKIFLLLDVYAKELAAKEGLQVATNFSMANANEGWINIRLVKHDLGEPNG